MADIRINALATTATTPASDDYLALDGAAQGTRKILATNIANNVTDVILGSSGPSVKSTLSARAPRQGLVFDGTFGASFSGVPAFGTGDFTVSAWINPSALTTAGIIAGATNSFAFRLQSNGTLTVGKVNASDGTPSTGVVSAGKFSHVSYVKSGSTGTYYINGISSGTSSETGLDYSVAATLVGAFAASTTQVFSGTISGGLIYNRALSASEVVALYEAGAPAGADYPTQVAGTALITGDSSTFTGGVGSWLGWFSGTVTAASGAATFTAAGGGITAAYLNITGIFKYGIKYRVKLDISTLTGGNLIISDTTVGANWATFTSTGSNQTAEFTINQSIPGGLAIKFSATGASAVIDNITLVPVGLLLAPDAAQAGGGLVWYDTSGNAANITLPASGVSWNVPSSRVLGGNWTTSGTLTISGGQAVNIGSSANYNLWKDATPTKAGRVILNNTVTNGLSLGLYDGSSWVDTLHIHPTNNNVLIGTTTDGGQKLQVSGTAAITGALSTTDVITNTVNNQEQFVLVKPVTGTFSPQQIVFKQYDANSASQTVATINTYKTTNTAGAINGQLVLVTSNAGTPTAALTLDSSQNATFAGSIAINNTVQTAVAVASTHKVTISIGGTTYYLLATNV